MLEYLIFAVGFFLFFRKFTGWLHHEQGLPLNEALTLGTIASFLWPIYTPLWLWHKGLSRLAMRVNPSVQKVFVPVPKSTQIRRNQERIKQLERELDLA